MARKRFALLSVSNKKWIETLARGLVDMGYSLLSTGGTGDAIEGAGLPVTRMADYIGAPSIMEGRIKTLHPKIHAGIIADDTHGQFADLSEIHAEPIDLVVVNLYPFEYAVASSGVTLDEALARFDLGGPALLRSAARNFQRVTAVCDPEDYETVLWHIAQDNDVPPGERLRLAIKALAHTVAYDSVVMSALPDFDPETGRKTTDN